MSKPEPDFSMDELYQQLAAELAVTQDAMTTQEMADAIGVSPQAVRRRLHILKQEGRLEKARKRIEDLGGRQLTVNAYRLK